MDDSTAVIGSPGVMNRTGAIMIMELNSSSLFFEVAVADLIVGLNESSECGFSIDNANMNILIGCPGDSTQDLEGGAAAFLIGSGSSWSIQKWFYNPLSSAGPGERFGFSVALSNLPEGYPLAVGSPFMENLYAAGSPNGYAVVWEYNAPNWEYGLPFDAYSPPAVYEDNMQFGDSLVLSELSQALYVGIPNLNVGQGEIRGFRRGVFVWDDEAVCQMPFDAGWAPGQVIIPAGARLGSVLAYANRNKLAPTSLYTSFMAFSSPNISMVFLSQQTNFNSVVQGSQTLPPLGAPPGWVPDSFGAAVAISSRYLAVAAPGSGKLFIFELSCPGGDIGSSPVNTVLDCQSTCDMGLVAGAPGAVRALQQPCRVCNGEKLDAVTCRECPAGSYLASWPQPGACVACVNALNASTCECAFGHYSNSSLPFASTCSPCFGALTSQAFQNGTVLQECAPCPLRHTTDGLGSCFACIGLYIDQTTCQPCLNGSFSPESGVCAQCDGTVAENGTVCISVPLESSGATADAGSGGGGDGDDSDTATLLGGSIGGGGGGALLLLLLLLLCLALFCCAFIMACCVFLLVVCLLVFVVVVLALFSGAASGALLWREKRRPVVMDLAAFEGYDGEVVEDGLTREFRELKFGELSFDRKIGEGAFGRVFAGRWRETTVVAIKELNVRSDEAAKREFVHEANIMARLGTHPNVVHFIGAVTTEEQFYMISEFAQNGSLLDYCMRLRKELTPRDLLALLRGAAAGVAHLHAEGVVHRDIAARNFLVSLDCRVVVTDFGLSRIAEAEGGAAEVQSTKSNIGPVRWMAPESILRREYSAKSDVYMFGCLILEVVTGNTPFEALTVQEVLVVMSQAGGAHPSIPMTCGAGFGSLMKKCWNHDPKLRPDITAVYAELENLENPNNHARYGEQIIASSSFPSFETSGKEEGKLLRYQELIAENKALKTEISNLMKKSE